MVRLHWFNLWPDPIITFGVSWWPINCFNRVCKGGDHYWGVGILQIESRHLFYVGHAGAALLFIGRPQVRANLWGRKK